MATIKNFLVVIREINSPLSESATMRNVLWQVDNMSGLLEPQTYGGVSLRSLVGHSCLSIPLAAITDSAKNVVFVVRADSTLERREVKLGADDGQWVEVISGLNEGEIVVTDSTEDLFDNMPVSVVLSDSLEAEGGN